MGRGPEQRPDFRRFARTALLGLAAAGVAVDVVSINSSTNTAEMYRAVDKSVPVSEGKPYDDAYWERIFTRLEETGVREQSRRESIVFYGGMMITFISALSFFALERPSKNHSAPQLQAALR